MHLCLISTSQRLKTVAHVPPMQDVERIPPTSDRWGFSPHPGSSVRTPSSHEVNVIFVVGVIAVQNRPTDELCCHCFQPWRCLTWSVNSNCIFFQERWYFVH